MRIRVAKSLVAPALLRHPDDTALVTAMGYVLARTGSFEEAKIHFLNAIRSNPQSVEPLIDLGCAYIACADLELVETAQSMAIRDADLVVARQYFMQAIHQNPLSLQARLNLAHVLLFQHHWSLAKTQFDK